jgi:hypothetical protein
MDALDRSVPIQFSDLIWCIGVRSNGYQGRGKGSPAARVPTDFPARSGQREVDGELPMNGDGEEVVDGVQKSTESSMV